MLLMIMRRWKEGGDLDEKKMETCQYNRLTEQWAV